MAKPWAEVSGSPEFQSLDEAGKQAAQQQYFSQVIAPQVPVEDLSIARNQFFGGVATKPAIDENAKSAPFSFKNLALSAGASGAGGIKALTDLFGATNAASEKLGEVQQAAQAMKTPERQAEIARREAIKERAKGNTLEEIKAVLGGVAEAPAEEIIGALFSGLPVIAGTMLAPAAAVPAGLARLGMAGKAINAARSPAAVIGGGMGLGGQKGQDYQTVKDEALAKGFKPEEAERMAQAASEYSLQNAPRQIASTLTGGLEGVLGVENVLGKLGKAAPKVEGASRGIKAPTVGEAVIKNVAGEAAPEFIQAATGQLGSNQALNQAGIPTDMMSGVLSSAIHDAVVGGALGGVTSPAKLSELRKTYVQDQLARERETQATIDAGIRAEEEKLAKTKETFKQPNVLALPAPTKEIAPSIDEPVLVNPLGNITTDELGPEVTGYINKYRKDNGMPRLQSYSIEDIKDAMTAVNPKGEQAALDSILTSKTGFSGTEKYTPEDVINAAVEKNVATETKGFNDFLSRTTGNADLTTMSPPQLFSAFKALKDMPANETGSQIVLPEGTNASRFKPAQYKKALEMVGMTFDEMGGSPLSIDTIVKDIQDSTGLETERDARSLLNLAIKNEDLAESRQVVFRTVKPDTGALVSTYTDKAKATAAAQKQGLNVQEGTLVTIQPAVKPEVIKPRATLPQGYDIAETNFLEGERPVGYNIAPEGRVKPLATVMEENDVPAKIERLQGLRRKEADKFLQDVAKHETTVNAGRAKLEAMEARGELETEGYKKAQAQQARAEDVLGRRISSLLDRIEEYSAPLTAKPVGKKNITRKGFTVSKEGQKSGTFPTREAAEESILADLPDEALDALVSDQKFGGLQNRAVAEQNRRRSEAPKTGKKVSEVLEGMKPKEEKQTQETIEKTADLRAMLDKFGLKDVGVKIVKAIQNNADGSYEAKLIQIALEAKNPIRTMRHEAMHALKELGFFTPQQWASLEKMAKDKWVNQYLKSSKAMLEDGKIVTRYEAYQLPKDQGGQGLTESEIYEEAIADAFGDFDVTKAPPGMLSALLNKMRNFFDALGNYLSGRGFESYKDVFGKIEKGELKATTPAKEGEAKKSLIRLAVEGETEISTRNPQGVKRTNDPIADMLSIDEAAVREAMKANPDMYKRTVQAIKGYGFVPNNTPPNEVINVFKRNIINNLLYLYNKVPADIRERSKLWYDGANRIATDMSKNYNVSMEQVAGIMAAMSPQKDWFQNVSMAERALDILTEQGDKAWDANMLKYAESYVKEATSRKEREKRQAAFDKIKGVARAGTTLNDMTQNDAAAFIRAYDEAYNARQYRIVTPEGGFGDFVRKNDGEPATMMWSTYDPIKKTVSIFRDGSRKNISEQLGEEHKIRSFYNNIAAPNSEIGHVTIDTHAVAAGLFEALAGTDQEVIHNFGGTGKNVNLGVGGTYGIIADAYREAARQKGIRAREMQSITWEAVRGLFGEDIKSTIKPKIRTEWSKYRNGEQSFDATRESIMEIAGGIDNPDWVGTDAGTTVSNGGASYNKEFTPEGGVRLRESNDIREKLTFNLSAVTSSIPGLRELYARAMRRDKEAYSLLQKVAESSLKFLLGGTGAKIKVEYAKGVYLSDREPSISVGVSFSEREMNDVMAGLAKFAESYNQQQIHVRQETAQKFGHDFGDGSYATAVYEINLKKQLNNNQISRVIEESGLQGFTITDQKLTTYFVRTEGDEQNNFKSFGERVKRVNELVGDGVSRPKQTVERLYVYGDGYGARIPYSEVAYPSSDIRTKQESDTVTPKLIAEYLTKSPVKTFKQKPLNAKQVKEQQKLASAFDAMPINDLKNPLVKRAYTALANSLKEQFKVMPIKVELMDSIDEPYANSDAVRRDVSLNNRFKVYATSPETFGPPGYDFKNHPLLKDSGLEDINGKPMLFNDLLRAVHDYFAHNLTATQFGPNGEAAAWRNHMAITPDPFARWALTAETRAQNAWQNFRPEAKGLNLIERGFADQKASLPPIEFVMTGDAKIDEPVVELKELLTPEQQRGSVPTTAKYSLRAAPDTPAFKQFFGKSKVVNADGTPKVMYHGTGQDILAFRGKQADAIFLTDDPSFAEKFSKDSAAWMSAHPEEFLSKAELAQGVKEAIAAIRKDYKSRPEGRVMIDSLKAGTYADATAEAQEYLRNAYKGMMPSGPNILPVYVSAQNPFDYENPAHIKKISQDLYPEEVAILEQGRWTLIEKAHIQREIKAAGFDGFYVMEGGNKNLAVYNPSQIKSATGNIGTYDVNNPDIRYSLRSIGDEIRSMPNGADIYDSIRRTTTKRDDKGFIERMMDAISPESISSLRQKALNRYNQLGVYDKKLAETMGGAALLADSSAESAALLSDLAAGVTAAALGVHNRKGGIPVLKQGYTTVDTSVKGPTEIFRPLAAMGDPEVYQAYQFWAGAKRGSRFLADGREEVFTPAMVNYAKQLCDVDAKGNVSGKYPEFAQVQKEWIQYNDGLVDYMVATGVLSKEKANEFKRHGDYIPFYRQLDGEKTVGPNIFQSIAGVKAPKALKGSEAPLADFLETVVRNTQAAIQAGMKNTAAQRAVDVAVQIGEAKKLPVQSSSPDTVTVLRGGNPVSYEVADPLFIDAVKSLNLPELPFLSILSGPANLLRNLVTKDPGFMLANLMRDSMSAYVTSGANMLPVVDTIKNFGRAVQGADPAYQALLNAGLLGGYEFSQNIEASGEALAKDLRKKTGTQTGFEKAAKPFTSLWGALEKGTEASDAATRMAVYKDTLARTGNEAEALARALEVMNFNRKGSSAVVRVLTAAIPFLNARMQGLDVFYRASFGRMGNQDAKAIQKSFLVRGATLASLSVMYWALTHDDDDYKKQEQETKDNNWLIPSLGVKIPIPFEVGILFKVIPERIAAYAFGNDTGKDFAKSMGRALTSTFGVAPPQVVLPYLEAKTNYSFYTGRPIVGQGMEGVAPEFQVGPGTSPIFQKLGKELGASPMMLEHMYKGYTGSMGMYLVDLLDVVGDLNSNSPKASKRFEQMPVIKRFAVDPEARGTVTSYYELKKAVDETVRTYNFLERTGKGDELGEYTRENAKLLMTRDFISSMDKDLKELQDMTVAVRNSPMESDAKRDTLTTLTRASNALTANIQNVRKAVE